MSRGHTFLSSRTGVGRDELNSPDVSFDPDSSVDQDRAIRIDRCTEAHSPIQAGMVIKMNVVSEERIIEGGGLVVISPRR